MQWALGKTGTEPEKDLEGNQKKTWKGNFFSPFRHPPIRKAILNLCPLIICSFRFWSRRIVFAKTCHSQFIVAVQHEQFLADISPVGHHAVAAMSTNNHLPAFGT